MSGAIRQFSARKPAAGGFAPTDIAGLQAWWKADAITGLSDGDQLLTWSDQSGNGNDAVQGDISPRPLYKTAIRNGLPVVRFDGVNDVLRTTAALFTGASARSIFAVYRSDRTGSFVDTIAGQSTGTTAGTWFQMQVRTASVVGDPYFAGFSRDVTGPTPDNLWKYAAVTYDGADILLRKNGVQVNGAARALNTANVVFSIGRDSGGGQLLGDVAEILVYNSALAGSDLSDLETYLASKWGF